MRIALLANRFQISLFTIHKITTNDLVYAFRLSAHKVPLSMADSHPQRPL